MRILFIRHAEAVEAESFRGNDLERPLTPAGRRSMKAAARTLARRYSKPDRLYCSAAVRAHQTAQILADAFGKAPLRETALLNPGATPAAFRRLLADAPARAGSIAVVGHEPDLSDFISLLVADGRLRLKLKKGSCVEVELAGRDRGILRALADPSLLGGKA